MEKTIHGEYLAPEIEVYTVRLQQVIATSGSIEKSVEDPESDL